MESALKNIYFLGIGGIGMSALARYFLHSNYRVAGYDRYRSPLCEQLESEGMEIHYQGDIQWVQKNLSKMDTLVIYTPAVPSDHPEKLYFEEHDFTLKKRAQVLGDISKQHRCLAIAGTHGKTTTSTLLAHLYRQANLEVSAFLGGISTNYQTNFWGTDETDLMITEADEYDRSFLQLQPVAAAITTTDPDHLDIYHESHQLTETFSQFGSQVTELLIAHENADVQADERYGFGPEVQYRAENIRVENHRHYFDLVYPQGRISDLYLGLPGRHNILNALAASALALNYGLQEEQVRTGLSSFRGIKRRFEYHIKQEKLVYIDDYAHHPTEINALYKAVEELYPKLKKTIIFQPHLYSRTRDFLSGFAESLSQFDQIILLPLYPAREKPLPGISSQALLEKIDHQNKALMGHQDVLDYFQGQKPELVLTVGAGDIDQLVQSLKIALLK